MDGKNIRQWFRDVFGSRVIEVMQTEILRMQMENQQLRQDKDQVIADLRNEKAMLQSKLAIFELSIQQRVGIDPSRTSAKKPSFANFSSPPVMTRWQMQVAEHEARLAAEEEKTATAAAE
jgi:hypothetical protein